MKKIVTRFLPEFLIARYKQYRSDRIFKNFRRDTLQETFSHIYMSKIWGESINPSQLFYSGTGSHNSSATDEYLNSLNMLLSSFNPKLNIVDLGCGDFNVGSKLRNSCLGYKAVDIVPTLIESNKIIYHDLGVEFYCMDITTSKKLPSGDVAILRQVLQHLSNDNIQDILKKVPNFYKYLILSEHISNSHRYKPNIDKKAGPDTRIDLDSGVDITSSPFNFKYKRTFVLCKTMDAGSLIITRVFEL